MKKSTYILLDMLEKLLGAFAIFLITSNPVIAGISFLAIMLNIFGIPLLFVHPLPWWIIYVIVIWWIWDIFDYDYIKGGE